jgi:hypothetical protein
VEFITQKRLQYKKIVVTLPRILEAYFMLIAKFFHIKRYKKYQ